MIPSFYRSNLGLSFLPIIILLIALQISADSGIVNQTASDKQSQNDCVFQTTYYDIRGRDLNELKEEMLLKGPLDSKGIRRFASVSWKVSWSWEMLSNGLPNYAKVAINPNINLILPRWSNQDLALVGESARWDALMNAIHDHEMQHVANACEAMREIKEVVLNSYNQDSYMLASAMNSKIANTVRKFKHLDYQFDQKTQNGRLMGVVL